MNQTDKNLLDAFAGESQANRRYLAFAKQAEAEGFPQIAKLFKAAAEAETVHALNHLRIAGAIKTTAENIDAAVTGETYEFMEMYPGFITTAKEEQNKKAEWSFDVANKVEQIHAKLFQKAAESMKTKADLPKTEMYVCSVCGNTVEGEAPDKCPICNAPKTAFNKIV